MFTFANVAGDTFDQQQVKAMRKSTKREVLCAALRLELFGEGVDSRPAAMLAKKTGVPAPTVRSWRSHPDRIPAWWADQVRELIRG